MFQMKPEESGSVWLLKAFFPLSVCLYVNFPHMKHETGFEEHFSHKPRINSNNP